MIGMRQWLKPELALELCTEMENIYPCQALPGSPLYYEARAKVWLPPETYAGYWFLSYESRPLPTKHFRAPDVLLNWPYRKAASRFIWKRDTANVKLAKISSKSMLGADKALGGIWKCLCYTFTSNPCDRYGKCVFCSP